MFSKSLNMKMQTHSVLKTLFRTLWKIQPRLRLRLRLLIRLTQGVQCNQSKVSAGTRCLGIIAHHRLSRFAILIGLLAANSSSANVVGTDTQNFNPISSGIDFVTVQSSETLRPGFLNLGLFANYAINSLPYLEESPQGRTKFNDTLLGADINLGLGLFNNWDIGLSAPSVLRQTVEDTNGARGEFANTGGTEFRVNTKFRFSGNELGGIAAVISAGFNRIQNNPYMGSGAGPTTTFELVGDRMIGNYSVGANFGYRKRIPGTALAGFIIQPVGDQWIGSFAISRYIRSHSTRIISELYGSLPTKRVDTNGDRALSSAEWLVGLKYDISQQLSLHLGLGTELAQGVASPDWRVYTGINWALGPLWRERLHTKAGETSHLEIVQVAQDASRYRTQSIQFEFDSDQMKGNFKIILKELQEYLSEKPFKKLVIEGHTDSVGKESYNLSLSIRRAAAIKRYMSQTYQIEAAKIQAIGFGETKPISDNANYQGRATNRRVEFEILR
jgi:outer membrane protein OmpA-like peptidoglycan-associated protein